MKKQESFSSAQTKKLGKDFALEILKKSPKGRAKIFVLSGELGSGKTTFIQGFLRGAGYKGRVTSPTFVLMKRFPIHKNNYKNIFHIDAYRTGKNEANHIMLKELISNPQNILLIEWGERFKNKLAGAKKIKFFHGKKENQRKIYI